VSIKSKNKDEDLKPYKPKIPFSLFHLPRRKSKVPYWEDIWGFDPTPSQVRALKSGALLRRCDVCGRYHTTRNLRTRCPYCKNSFL